MFVESTSAPAPWPLTQQTQPPIHTIDTTSRVISFVLGFALASLIAWVGSISGDDVPATGNSAPVTAVGRPVVAASIQEKTRATNRELEAPTPTPVAALSTTSATPTRAPEVRAEAHPASPPPVASQKQPSLRRRHRRRGPGKRLAFGKRLSRGPGVDLQPGWCTGRPERKDCRKDACGAERSAGGIARDRRPPRRLFALVGERPRDCQSAHDGASHAPSGGRRLDRFGASLDANTAGATASRPLQSTPTDRRAWRGVIGNRRRARDRRRQACYSQSPTPQVCGRLAPATTPAAAG